MDKSNNSPRERNDEEKGIPVQEGIEGGRIQILDEVETSTPNPNNNRLPNPSFPKVPYPRRKLETLLNQINDALQKQDNGKSLRNNEHVKAFEASYDELQKDEKEEKEETSSELIKVVE
ncbi:hypothetical protein LWI28_001906 [Acer negundo]|uniref:Uncharacterized protein n=1 Tax=Acer negundo TaxID=4023 RepID=A0AAD5J7R4_ACENE|nr:hypothetical protein LWI28_001906 [Acer negundo]